MVVQVADAADQMDADFLASEAQANPPLHELLLKHHQAFLSQITQSVACNGLHSVSQRCCRWLLMTQDRVEGDSLPLTHEFLAMMMAVRRPGVTETLNALQDQGLITNGRGAIKIENRKGLEAAACDCYRAVVKEYERLLGRE